MQCEKCIIFENKQKRTYGISLIVTDTVAHVEDPTGTWLLLQVHDALAVSEAHLIEYLENVELARLQAMLEQPLFGRHVLLVPVDRLSCSFGGCRVPGSVTGRLAVLNGRAQRVDKRAQIVHGLLGQLSLLEYGHHVVLDAGAGWCAAELALVHEHGALGRIAVHRTGHKVVVLLE